MKLDLLNSNWLEIVFEGRNQKYGAYDLRKSITKNTTRAFIIATLLFAILVSIPTLLRMIPEGTDETILDQKITTVKLPPKEIPKENLPPPPPPPPKVDLPISIGGQGFIGRTGLGISSFIVLEMFDIKSHIWSVG